MSYLVKSNFITSYLAFRGLIPTNSYQPQKQTRYYRKNLLYSYVTFLYHPTTRYHLFSISSLLQWYFSSLDYATIPNNSILDNIDNINTDKPKGFLCCYRSNKNHLECTHSNLYYSLPYSLSYSLHKKFDFVLTNIF